MCMRKLVRVPLVSLTNAQTSLITPSVPLRSRRRSIWGCAIVTCDVRKWPKPSRSVQCQNRKSTFISIQIANTVWESSRPGRSRDTYIFALSCVIVVAWRTTFCKRLVRKSRRSSATKVVTQYRRHHNLSNMQISAQKRASRSLKTSSKNAKPLAITFSGMEAVIRTMLIW